MYEAIDARQAVLAVGSYIERMRREGIVLSVDALDEAAEVHMATDDSRRVREGALFVCKGAAFSRSYLLDAVDAGALAYVSETDYSVGCPCILVSDVRRALAVIADLSFDHPSGRLDICAFTGTKGKTTCAYYLKGILDAQASIDGEAPTPFLSSIAYDDGVRSGVSKLTTPEPFELEQRLANAVSVGARRLVMEASSQALKYGRVHGLDFAVGAFTNIGEDHISPIEHPTFEDYFESKLKIFDQSRTAVVNLDMDHAEEVLERAGSCDQLVTYSMSGRTADVAALGVEPCGEGMRVRVRTPRFTTELTISTPVRFNVENALGAIACAEALGVSREAIERGVSKVLVPGRMELYPCEGRDILGIVDYAHNGMSLEVLLRDLRASYPGREIAVVFGATGGKGVDRRETMGRVAGRLADRIVITEDDPGPEDPADICQAIAHFVEEQGNHAWKIVPDRAEAIRTCVRETRGPALVVVTGKGAEERMLRKNGAEPCERDGAVLRRALDDLA